MYHAGVDFVSPMEALFPGASASVLAVLSRTEQPLTIRQVAERSGVSHPQVGRHVARLEALGVVSREVVGRSHLVRLTGSAASEALRRLDQVGREVLDHARTTAEELQPNALSVTVFGSFARGTAVAGSDIDVAIVAADPDDEAWLATLARWADVLAERAGNPVAEIVVSVEELVERSGDPVWVAVMAEGITVAGQPVTQVVEAAGTGESRR